MTRCDVSERILNHAILIKLPFFPFTLLLNGINTRIHFTTGKQAFNWALVMSNCSF